MEEKTPTSAGLKCRWKIVVVSIGLLFLVLGGVAWVMQLPSVEQKPISEQADFSMDRPHRGPKIVDNPLNEGGRPRHLCPEDKDEPLILSWDFINGLFAVILVLEFIVFPILFWVWFRPIHKK